MIGDGWNGGVYSIIDNNGTVYSYGTLSTGSTSTISNIAYHIVQFLDVQIQMLQIIIH